MEEGGRSACRKLGKIQETKIDFSYFTEERIPVSCTFRSDIISIKILLFLLRNLPEMKCMSLTRTGPIPMTLAVVSSNMKNVLFFMLVNFKNRQIYLLFFSEYCVPFLTKKKNRFFIIFFFWGGRGGGGLHVVYYRPQ